ncbi:unnamed protein product [Mesocestoides corti]|uniref:Uncharacterized protein n=1 Tax=Mesocestoides corti TaxID=53468 RepID=A0A0R3UR14_MESCO|nr:unnamed protein product [Mesocestoides corti]
MWFTQPAIVGVAFLETEVHRMHGTLSHFLGLLKRQWTSGFRAVKVENRDEENTKGNSVAVTDVGLIVGLMEWDTDDDMIGVGGGMFSVPLSTGRAFLESGRRRHRPNSAISVKCTSGIPRITSHNP